MDDIMRLFSLSLAMLAGCYVSGSIPLVFTLSEKRLKMVTVLGAGLLVGTALAVIIPEGVHALYDQQIHAHQHSHGSRHLHHVVDKGVSTPDSPKSQEATSQFLALREHIPKVDTNVFIGLSLCCGFVFMLLIDQLSGGHSHGGPSTADIESSTRQRHKKSTATIGLVVHAAADGVALGAAVSTSKTEVEMIVFLAIMLHKAPAAFGLTTFLLHEGFERNRIRKHLLMFATAAPLLALLTFFGLSQSSKEVLSSVNGTGIAMLFSAGTFLYVATVHVLPEIEHWSSNSPESSDQGRSENGKLQRTDLFLLVCGILAPLLISQTHSH